ncbi:hypothetical protein TRAPUB_9343 [Trametes pubescens]|uniref:Uncharacterized protein n=1 Tax=Trametes pubescens TaxID=154538 RepID=A0A1M2W2M0_TRAPU|nr:hypothetical protein TRAPUB_9343 [Trametes pubescens]
MPARCFQCKTAVGGWGTGRQHAAITGHTWQPGYYCPHCEATFSSHKLCKSHMKTCPPRAGPALPFVTEADDTPVRAARTVSHERRTSIAAIVSCRTCGEHFRDEETLEKAVRDAEVHTTKVGPSSLSDTNTSSVAPEQAGVENERVVKYVVSALVCAALCAFLIRPDTIVDSAPRSRMWAACRLQQDRTARPFERSPRPAHQPSNSIRQTRSLPSLPKTTSQGYKHIPCDPCARQICSSTRVSRPALAVPKLDDDAVEYDGFTDDADRSSVIAKAALDLISQRYGGTAAERVLRAMQELGGAIAEEQNARDGTESLQPAADAQEELTTPLKDRATDSCGSPSSAVRRFVDTQRAALAAEVM